jgi:hypothetical protein
MIRLMVDQEMVNNSKMEDQVMESKMVVQAKENKMEDQAMENKTVDLEVKVMIQEINKMNALLENHYVI